MKWLAAVILTSIVGVFAWLVACKIMPVWIAGETQDETGEYNP